MTEAKVTLSAGAHLRNHHQRVFGSCVARRAEDPCILEANAAKFFKESPAFLGAGDSGKPVVGVALKFPHHPEYALQRSGRLADHNLGGVDFPSGAHHSGKFFEDQTSRGIEVKDAVDQGHINRTTRQR